MGGRSVSPAVVAASRELLLATKAMQAVVSEWAVDTRKNMS